MDERVSVAETIADGCNLSQLIRWLRDEKREVCLLVDGCQRHGVIVGGANEQHGSFVLLRCDPYSTLGTANLLALRLDRITTIGWVEPAN